MRMKNINVIGLLVVILIGVGIWIVITLQEGGDFLEILSPEHVARTGEVGYGWSEKDDVKEAAAEAISMVKEDLEGKAPKYVILFSTVGYDLEELSEEVRKSFPQAQIYGGTSNATVMTHEGCKIGEVGSLALMAISSEKITFGVGGADMNEYGSAREAGESAAQIALKNAGKEGETPKIILLTAAPGQEEDILLGIEDVVGKDVPIHGGSSLDNDFTGKWKQFANDKVYGNGISLTVIFTELKVAHAFEGAYLRTEKRAFITKAEGRTIYEIDNRPAAEVYNEWTDGLIEPLLETGGSTFSIREVIFSPIGQLIKTETEEVFINQVLVLTVNLPEKSLGTGVNVNTGDEITLMRGNWEILLNRGKTTAVKALASQGISSGEALFGVYTYCGSTFAAVPRDEIGRLPSLISNVIGKEIPFIGLATGGEQGYIEGKGNRHGNFIHSLVIFSE